MSTTIQIAGFPHVANSSFTGETYGKLEVEQVLRAGKSAGSSDYAVVLRDRFNPTHRAVVSYTRFLTAVRNTTAQTVSEPDVGNVSCGGTAVKKDKDWAFDRMTELLRVAMYDKEVADVIKRLTHVL
jgi:hypothetical protein